MERKVNAVKLRHDAHADLVGKSPLDHVVPVLAGLDRVVGDVGKHRLIGAMGERTVEVRKCAVEGGESVARKLQLALVRVLPPRIPCCLPDGREWHVVPRSASLGLQPVGTPKVEDVRTVDDLVGERLRRFVLVHRADEKRILIGEKAYRRFIDRLAVLALGAEALEDLKRNDAEVLRRERCHETAHFELAQELTKIVFDAGEVHLVEHRHEHVVLHVRVRREILGVQSLELEERAGERRRLIAVRDVVEKPK